MPADLHPKIVHHDREMGVIALSKSIVGFIPLAGRVDALQPAARAERPSAAPPRRQRSSRERERFIIERRMNCLFITAGGRKVRVFELVR